VTQSPNEIADILNDLLETCYDGLDGFRAAATTVERPDAIALFESRIQRIDGAAAELYTAIRRIGGHPADHGHPEAFLHRGWMHLRAALGRRGGDDGVLAAVESGEQEAVRRYRRALAQSLPSDLHDLVADQLDGAERNLECVQDLRRYPPPA
jgi:uncharacterized protein (TIGR02284 family)